MYVVRIQPYFIVEINITHEYYNKYTRLIRTNRDWFTFIIQPTILKFYSPSKWRIKITPIKHSIFQMYTLPILFINLFETNLLGRQFAVDKRFGSANSKDPNNVVESRNTHRSKSWHRLSAVYSSVTAASSIQDAPLLLTLFRFPATMTARSSTSLRLFFSPQWQLRLRPCYSVYRHTYSSGTSGDLLSFFPQ